MGVTEGNHLHGKKKRRRRIWALVLILFAAFAFSAFDIRLSVRRYGIDAREITNKIRIAFISDLHSCRYGEGQKTLIDRVNDLKPDLVLLGGDIFDDVLPDENTDLFISAVSDEYPCYYVTGNHEYWSGEERFLEQMAILKKHGVTILSGEYETVFINGEYINLCGIDDPDAFDAVGTEDQLKRVNAVSENGYYTILLAHRPEQFDLYAGYDFDLALCGHAHGGQWRIPWVLNGLYAPDQGLFPEYAGGLYTKNDTTMIVGRGLSRESTLVPRIFNRPEIVLLEIE